ncbi:uncharacterized protein LOC143084144 [Mytilus galloprovincialis]|uniref:uncharacterized protein LOC143084144 n=1 Tax=Mytilus galloprovincialis TaxID=29158 RepID=UPI003F7C5CA0
MKTVFHSLLLFSLLSGFIGKIAAATNIYAKNGSQAFLPCEWADDSVRWYGVGDHQYSTGNNILQSLPISLRQRLQIINDNGFNLVINDIHKDDEGSYKCISDNGTINYNLYLIVAPSKISLRSSTDENVITVDANKMFNATCEADGGFPPPVLSLMMNETLLTRTETRILSYTINPTRTDDFTNVTCTANHSELNHPLEIHAMFYLNLSPIHLTMIELPTLFEGKLVNISCISIGSRPQASSEWTIDGYVISNSSEDQSEIINPTETYRITSILSVEFNRLQNRKELSCRSYNLADTKGIIQSRMIEVYYHPSIEITYKNTTEDEELRQFNCKPNGNPAVYEFDKWEHFSMHNQFIRHLEGRKTATGAGEVILPVTNLNERYQDSGIYICRAQNDIADKYGNKMQNGYVSFISEGTPAAASENVYSNKGKLEDDTILIVKFVSLPAPIDVFWFKIDDGRDVLINNSKKYTKVITPAIIQDSFHGQIIHVDGYIISLFIRNLEVKDFSKYNCEVHNRYGNISLTVELVQLAELENAREGGWQIAGIVLITIVVLMVVLTVAFFIYKKRISGSKSDRPVEFTELNHQRHDGVQDPINRAPPPLHVAERYVDDVQDPINRAPDPLAVAERRIDGTNQCNVVQDHRETVNKEDNCRVSIDNVYIVPENQHKHVVQDPTNRAPALLPDERYFDNTGHPSKTENLQNDILYTAPCEPAENDSIDRADSIINQPKCQPAEIISSEQKQTMNHSTAILRPSPLSSQVEDINVFSKTTSVDVEYSQSSKMNVVNRFPDAVVSDTDSSSGFASFHGPDSMDQRSSIPRPIQHLLQDGLNQEDEAIAIDNPSYQVEKDDDIYHDAQSKPCKVSSVSSEDVGSQEKTSTEEVHPPTTNTDKRKPLQYYPTFPKLNNSDDEPWTKPAEPIKVLDASQEETQPMELNLKITDHNDEDKTDSTSEDNDPETQN